MSSGLKAAPLQVELSKTKKKTKIKKDQNIVNLIILIYNFILIEVLRSANTCLSFHFLSRYPLVISSRVVNPVFSLNRKNDADGTPKSSLYNAMYDKFPTTVLAAIDPRTRFTTAVLNVLPESASFIEIQQALGEQSLALFGEAIDFTRRTDGTPATQEAIDALMGFDEETTREAYMDALIGACALEVWETLPTPPFYSIPAAVSEAVKTERLSILTQFFLANLNVYCKAKGISGQNFGLVLDESVALSADLVNRVAEALTNGEDVERSIWNFCNEHAERFELSRELNAEDLTAIRQKFERTYRTISTGENPHMDDFMILDLDAEGETAKFVTHQGSICVNFAEIITPVAESSYRADFDSIRADFSEHPAEVPHQNELAEGTLEVDVERLLASVTDQQFERLPTAVQEICRDHPSFHAHPFLGHVARGEQEEAEAVLTQEPANTQALLRAQRLFVDYSGRVFECTAYEYAYWAKDTHMCRMLEGHMDEDTKANLLARIDENDREGLLIEQNGELYRSAHFDFTELKTALQSYVDGYAGWRERRDREAMSNARKALGNAQRNVPAHIAQEYCRLDRSFSPCPSFEEEILPRVLMFKDSGSLHGRQIHWFDARLGVGDKTEVVRGRFNDARDGADAAAVSLDLEAMTRLDEVRTAELAQLRERLNPPAEFPGPAAM